MKNVPQKPIMSLAVLSGETLRPSTRITAAGPSPLWSIQPEVLGSSMFILTLGLRYKGLAVKWHGRKFALFPTVAGK